MGRVSLEIGKGLSSELVLQRLTKWAKNKFCELEMKRKRLLRRRDALLSVSRRLFH